MTPREAEAQHAATQPTGATILWGGGVALLEVLCVLAILGPAWVLVALLKVAVFVGAAGFLVVCLARSGEL